MNVYYLKSEAYGSWLRGALYGRCQPRDSHAVQMMLVAMLVFRNAICVFERVSKKGRHTHISKRQMKGNS